MKLLLIAAVLACAALFATRRATPFLRWGIVCAVLGVLLISSAALFAVRGVMYGAVLLGIGACIYGYGRVVRRERFFVSRR